MNVREFCVTFPGAYLDNPWGHGDDVVKVGGKIFAFLGSPDAEHPAIAVKNTPEEVEEWRQRYPDHIGPGPYLKKTLWNRVVLDGAGAPEDDEICELIEDSYTLVVAALPRARRPA